MIKVGSTVVFAAYYDIDEDEWQSPIQSYNLPSNVAMNEPLIVSTFNENTEEFCNYIDERFLYEESPGCEYLLSLSKKTGERISGHYFIGEVDEVCETIVEEI